MLIDILPQLSETTQVLSSDDIFISGTYNSFLFCLLLLIYLNRMLSQAAVWRWII